MRLRKKKSIADLLEAILLPVILIFSAAALLLWAVQPANGAMPDCIDSTCRVTAEDGSRGTGSVFLIEDDRVFVLTNAHVATSIRMELEFWSDGHLSSKVAGSTVLKVTSRDVAVISIEASVFGQLLPTAIPLAPLGTELRIGQAVTSVGCAKGAWATAWRGHVREDIEKGGLAFNPAPAIGRSGSAVYDNDGKWIVGLIRAQRLDEVSETPIYGLAINIENIYAAIYGKMVKTSCTVSDREVFWPPQKQVQCGPQGCPAPRRQIDKWRPMVPVVPNRGYILPYRHQQQRIDRRQNEQIRRLYPTKPREVPKIENETIPLAVSEPELESKPEPKPEPTVDYKLPLGLLIVGYLVFALVGGIAGLISGWRKAHYKSK